MGQQSTWRLLARYSLPSIVSMTVASTYNIVDAIFVGRLGTEALAAMVVSYPVMMLMMAISFGTGIGAASLIARNMGAGKHEEASRVACVTLSLGLIIGALFTIVCLPALSILLRLLGATGNVLPLAHSYMSILLIWAVVDVFSMILPTLIRAEGSPIFPSTVGILSAVTNIILDPALIFGWGILPAMGVQGAAIATVIARAVSMVIFMGYLISGKSEYHFKLNYFIPDLKILKEIYRTGLASIVRMGAQSLIMIPINRIALGFGVSTLAVLGVLFRIASFGFMACIGIGQGMLPLVGYNYGAKKFDRVREIVLKASFLAGIWSILCLIIVMIIPSQVMSLFNTDPEFIEKGTYAIRIFAIGFLSIGLQNTLSSFFQGIGRGLASLILSSSRQILFLLPVVLILPRFFGETWLWASFPIADAMAISMSIIWTIIEFRSLGVPLWVRKKLIQD